MARLKWLRRRLYIDTMVTNEYETDEHLNFLLLDLQNQEINAKIIVVKDAPYKVVKRFKP